MKKHIIIASHSYTAYYNIIKPLVTHLSEKDCYITFVHLNNLSSKVQIEEDSSISQIDFSIIRPRKFLKYIKEKRPTHIFCLEFTSLFIISLLRILKTFNIKSVYFEHGIFIEGHGDKFLVKSFKDSLFRYLKLGVVYIRYIVLTNLSFFSEAKYIYKTFFKRDYAGFFESGLFYSERGYKLLVNKLKLPSNNVKYSGYPVTMYEKDLTTLRMAQKFETNNALYIHQPLIADGISKLTYEEEIEYLTLIDDICKEFGLEMIIKLHPRADLNFYKTKSQQLNFSKDELYTLLKNTKIVIGQFSTAIFNGYVLNIPVILFPYSDLDEMYYKSFLPYSYISRNSDEFKIVMNEIKESESVKNNINIKELIGDCNTFENQADVIISIILKK